MKTSLPVYVCHKRVKAAPLIAVLPSLGFVIVDNGEPDGARIPVKPEMFARGTPEPGDYFVVYEDGYLSWSPKATFEAGYTREGA